MIAFPETVKQLKDFLNGFPDDMKVVSVNYGYVDLLQTELIYIKKTSSYDWIKSGDEGERPIRPGEVMVIRIS